MLYIASARSSVHIGPLREKLFVRALPNLHPSYSFTFFPKNGNFDLMCKA
jgi:hypothetical protein